MAVYIQFSGNRGILVPFDVFYFMSSICEAVN